jgi:PAS domain-containing protein
LKWAKRRPALSPGYRPPSHPGKIPCLYAYPIFSGEDIDAFVMLDFDFPALDALEVKLQRTNAFLSNLIHSAVDCVIAADRTGKILIFNDSAAKVFGYTVEEALSGLNIRDVYPDDNAREVMRILRSEEYGGKGKLKTYHTGENESNQVPKTDEIIQILIVDDEQNTFSCPSSPS